MKLNEQVVRGLPAPDRGSRVHYFAGALAQGVTAPRGFGVNVTYTGAKSFVLNYRVDGVRERRLTIGRHPDWNCAQAVREARTLRKRIDRGEDPLRERHKPEPETPKSVVDVIGDWLTRHASKLRTGKIIEANLNRLVIPEIGALGIYDLRRRHVADLFDSIEDAAGPAQAAKMIGALRSALTWYSARDDEFVLPFARGMVHNRATVRDRILTDDEIRALWPALTGTFGNICKVLLLTGQRRNEVSWMMWEEITGDVWLIPAERYKTGIAHTVPLTAPVLDIVHRQPREHEHVFVGQRGTKFQNFSDQKRQLDRHVSIGDWRLHDLRRTARSLLARAGVSREVAERVVGHKQSAMEAVYNRHDYANEKRAALEALAAMVDRILNPPDENVVPLRQEAR